MVGSWLMALVWVLSPGFADTIHLTTGGKISGTLTRVTFVKDGKEMVLYKEQLADVSELTLGAAGDSIVVKDEEWKGKIKSVNIKSLGGELVCPRNEISQIVKQVSERERALAEYRKKSGKLSDDNAAGWYRLAVWAGQHRLRSEQLLAARKSLECDPDHAQHADAHGLLGHVLKDGRWLTAEEAKALAEEEEKAKEEEMRAKGLVKYRNRWVEAEQKERIEGLTERVLELEKQIGEELEAQANATVEEFKEEMDAAERNLKSAEGGYEGAKAERNEHLGHSGCIGLTTALANIKRFKSEIKTQTEALTKVRSKRAATATKLKSQVAKMKREVHNNALRTIRKIEAGEEVDEFDLGKELRPKGLD